MMLRRDLCFFFLQYVSAFSFSVSSSTSLYPSSLRFSLLPRARIMVHTVSKVVSFFGLNAGMFFQ